MSSTSTDQRIAALEGLVNALISNKMESVSAFSSSATEQKIATLETLVNSLMSNKLTSGGERDLTATVFNDGDTAWMLTSTALVLFMTLPGLALFYSGMVRATNVLSTVMQIISIACLITVLWLWYGYSLSFAPASPAHGNVGLTRRPSTPIYGDGSRLWLRGMHIDSAHQLAPTIPESVFCMYQLTFAIITPAVICGSFADRMKYVPMLVFMALWHTVVYCPIAHAVWHPDGFLYQAGVLDFAGGYVVEIASGISGIVSSIVIGNRRGFGKSRFEPHNILLTFMGTGMLWVGWFGFNAGSAVAANGRAGMALLVTHITGSVAALSWLATESYFRGQPSVLGMVSGAVAGLVCITPGAGFVDPVGAFFIGLIGGPLCYFGAQLKHYLGFDDALDAFGVHAIGGIVGSIATGFFATRAIGGYDGVFYGSVEVGGNQLAMQLYGIVVTGGWSAFASWILLVAVDKTLGLRVSAEDEDTGLDSSYHGETIVHLTGLKEQSDQHLSRNIEYEMVPKSTTPVVTTEVATNGNPAADV